MSEFTRRELFHKFRENAAKTASRTVHTLEKTMKKKLGIRAPFPFADIEVTDECCGCEVCANLCPEGALKWSSCEGGKQLQFAQHLCTACGTCRDSCIQKAMQFSGTLSPDHPIGRENKTIITVSAFNCKHCSIKSFSNKGEKICFVCKARSMRKGGVKCSV